MNKLKFIYIFTIFSPLYLSTLVGKITPSQPTLQIKDTQNSRQIQQIEPNNTNANLFEQNRDLILKFTKQPHFTKSSIKCFFRHTFNNPYYADRYLPFDLSHILTFSGFASQTVKPREYLFNVISIFEQKLFFSGFINGYEFEEFLKNYILLISQYFNQKTEKEERINQIKEKLYTLLCNDFDKLKANPEKILNETAISIDLIATNTSMTQDDIDLPISRLQDAVLGLFKICLSDLIWSPVDHIKIWKSIKSISSMLEECLQKQILIDSHNLNQLFWCLIARFSYFIALWGNNLPESFYTDIIDEINSKPCNLWNIKENDPLLLSKFRHLNYILNQGTLRSKLHLNKVNLLPVQQDKSSS